MTYGSPKREILTAVSLWVSLLIYVFGKWREKPHKHLRGQVVTEEQSGRNAHKKGYILENILEALEPWGTIFRTPLSFLCIPQMVSPRPAGLLLTIDGDRWHCAVIMIISTVPRLNFCAITSPLCKSLWTCQDESGQSHCLIRQGQVGSIARSEVGEALVQAMKPMYRNQWWVVS
jgi:hypothetical protein